MARGFLAEHGLDEVYGIDFETYFAKDYSLRLKAYPTTMYIADPQFKVHMASVQSSRQRTAKVYNPTEFRRWLKTIDWKRCGVLAHHAHFDGFILAHHFGVVPAYYFDTLSMARPVMPVRHGLGLDALCRAFGIEGKVGAESLENVKGVRDLTPAQFKALAKYAGNDIEKTWWLFRRLLPYLTQEELRIVDLTLRMYTQPSVALDHDLIHATLQQEQEAKALLLQKLKVKASQLRSAEQFAVLLREAGCEPPTKINKNGQMKYAFAKGDTQFKALLKHDKPRVCQLVEARLGISSSILERRCERMLARQHLQAQPIYLNYWGARATGRWSGGDKVNWQNWPKRDAFKRPVQLRKALRAPEGHAFIIADQRQVEARLANWQAGNTHIVEAFARGQDVYRLTASGLYRLPPEEISGEQRFVGKTTTLGCIYGIGAVRFANTLRAGVMGPEVEISDEEARRIISAWRRTNRPIADYWKVLEGHARTAWLNDLKIEVAGGVVFEGAAPNGFIHLPNGTSLRYDDVAVDDGMALSYLREVKSSGAHVRTRLWGGHIFENITQALARALLARQLIILAQKYPWIRIASLTHDEVLAVVPIRRAETGLKAIVKTMRDVPNWAKGVPLDVDAKVSAIYDKE